MKKIAITGCKEFVANKYNLENSIICIGNFDGFHSAHMELVKKTFSIAEKCGLKTGLITLSKRVVDYDADNNHQIITNQLKEAICKKIGFDFYFEYLINQENKKISAKEFAFFLKDILLVKKVVIGFDFHFGYKRQGNFQTLIDVFGSENIFIIDEIRDKQNNKVSSSQIRQLLAEHQIAAANKLLIEPYQYNGVIVKGKQLGRTISFPTINQEITKKLLIPLGTYITTVLINSKTYKSMSCYFYKKQQLMLETNIFDFNENVYGEYATVYFQKYMRENWKINSLEDLKVLLEKDKLAANLFFKKNE